MKDGESLSHRVVRRPRRMKKRQTPVLSDFPLCVLPCAACCGYCNCFCPESLADSVFLFP